MKEQLVSFETAKLAKEKGFDWHILYGVDSESGDRKPYDIEGGYTNWNATEHSISAPTQSLLQKWLREKHKLHVEITYEGDNRWYGKIIHLIKDDVLREVVGNSIYGNSLESKLKEGLQEALQLI